MIWVITWLMLGYLHYHGYNNKHLVYEKLQTFPDKFMVSIKKFEIRLIPFHRRFFPFDHAAKASPSSSEASLTSTR